MTKWSSSDKNTNIQMIGKVTEPPIITENIPVMIPTTPSETKAISQFFPEVTLNEKTAKDKPMER
ncbi:hypothetical protein D3C86_1354370 [compost metagenome]